MRNPIPKGLRLSAQSCEERATLGHRSQIFSNPERVAACGSRFDATPLGLTNPLTPIPRVARSSQPWAGRRSPVGAAEKDKIPSGYSSHHQRWSLPVAELAFASRAGSFTRWLPLQAEREDDYCGQGHGDAEKVDPANKRPSQSLNLAQHI